MNYILGLNAIGFNTSASLLKNGKLIGAIEEERLTRNKRTRSFPNLSIEYLLKKNNLSFEDINAVGISWNPTINLEKFDKANSTNHSYIPNILHTVPSNLMHFSNRKTFRYFKQELSIKKNKKIPIYYINHHYCHAANFFISPFKNSSILTVDAFGEKQSVGFFKGKNNEINSIWSQEFPHSLGAFYSTFTEICGFKPQNDEWKLMGAAAYGNKNIYYKKIRNLVSLIPNTGFELDLKFFNHYMFHRPHYFNKKLLSYLEIKQNTDEVLNKKYYNLAAASQLVFEDIYFHLINSLFKKSESYNLVISGGSALNSLANGKVLNKTKFKNLFVPPVPDDSGAGLGAANYCFNVINKKKKRYVMNNNFLGPEFSNNEIRKILNKYKIKYQYLDNVSKEAAKSIANSKIIGWFQGKIEFGDRALGNRSILADPRNKNMKSRVNKSIKYREQFRPFAPAILNEYTSDFFENPQSSFFMERTLKIKKIKRKLIPAVTHLDGTGRLQTVNKVNNQKFYELIVEFFKLTKIPIVLNTSLNYKGDPIVCSPDDAIKTFYLSGLDELYLGNYRVIK
tara:strand:+ start:9381 stop:11078 length:1698 start_codon:yes stop_codon:yes gene_type:complete